jgi:hypothetical protein
LGYRIPFIRTPPSAEVGKDFVRSHSAHEIALMKKEINNLLLKGAIRTANRAADQFVSPIFLVPKPNGGQRFILNLKKLNEFIKLSHFKMEDYRSVKRILRKGNFMASIDLRDAYFLIPIHKAYQKYLRFIFAGETYEFMSSFWIMHSAVSIHKTA